MGQKVRIPGKTNPVDLDDPIDGVKNFTWGEALHRGNRLPKNWRITANIISVAKRMQHYRDHVFGGRPVKVTSWLRLGNGGSAHDHGLAVDFVIDGLSPYTVYMKLQHHDGGLGLYDAHTHVDLWHKRRWRGVSR